MRFYTLQRSEMMLVLSRCKDEEIVIGNEIRVMVIDVRGDNVRLGITAPRDVSIHRREVYDKIQEEQAATDLDCD
jgi:carbon storage regulator